MSCLDELEEWTVDRFGKYEWDNISANVEEILSSVHHNAQLVDQLTVLYLSTFSPEIGDDQEGFNADLELFKTEFTRILQYCEPYNDFESMSRKQRRF
jgi:hypothetical protein